MFGLFTLVACSEDVIPETTDEKQDEGIAPPTIDPNTGYQSPYHVSNVGMPIKYILRNDTNFTVTVIPYVGLAYYDGIDDGHYAPQGINITFGFPNLYAGGKEYLNIIGGAPITLPPNTNQMNHSQHCPVLLGGGPFTFDLSGSGLTGGEENLLSLTGKLYYLDVTVTGPGGILVSELLKAQFIGDPVIIPTPTYFTWNHFTPTTTFTDNFFFETTSQEIIVGNTTGGTLSKVPFYDASTGNWHTIHLFNTSTDVMLLVN